MNRFSSWLEKARQEADAGLESYARVADRGGPPGARAAAQAGRLQLHLAALLRWIEIPADVRRGRLAREATAAYCDALDGVAEPLEIAAERSFERCRELAVAHGLPKKQCEP